MQKRAEEISGKINVTTGRDKGTVTALWVNII